MHIMERVRECVWSKMTHFICTYALVYLQWLPRVHVLQVHKTIECPICCFRFQKGAHESPLCSWWYAPLMRTYANGPAPSSSKELWMKARDLPNTYRCCTVYLEHVRGCSHNSNLHNLHSSHVNRVKQTIQVYHHFILQRGRNRLKLMESSKSFFRNFM